MSELPPGWGATTLGAVCQPPQYGWTASASRNACQFKLLRTTDLRDGSVDWTSVPFASSAPDLPERYLVRNGDVFISRAGSIGTSAVIENPPEGVLFASYLIRMTPLISELAPFLKYFLLSPGYWDQVRGQTIGIAIPNINASKLSSIRLPFPPLPEQRRIVAEIEKQFTRLQEAHQFIAQARTRVRQLRRAAIANACVPFTSRKHVRFGELTMSLRNGISEKPTATSGFPVLKISAVRPFRVNLDERRYLSDVSSHSGFELKENDLLFTRYNGNPQFVGICARVPKLEQAVYYPDKLIRARLRAGHEARFYELMFNGGEASEYIRERVRTTAGQSGISGADIKSAPVPIATAEEQSAAVERTEQILSNADRLESELAMLITHAAHLRQAILAKAFSGQLVPQAPKDEPASVLLERIRAEREAYRPNAPRRRRASAQLEFSAS